MQDNLKKFFFFLLKICSKLNKEVKPYILIHSFFKQKQKRRQIHNLEIQRVDVTYSYKQGFLNLSTIVIWTRCLQQLYS